MDGNDPLFRSTRKQAKPHDAAWPVWGWMFLAWVIFVAVVFSWYLQEGRGCPWLPERLDVVRP